MGRPSQDHRRGVRGNFLHCLSAGGRIDVEGGIGPRKIIDAGRIRVVLEEARRRESAFLVAAVDVLLGEVEGRRDVAARRRSVGNVHVIDVVADFSLELREGGDPEMLEEARNCVVHRFPIQVAGRSTGFRSIVR
jgi:hypothetical protein